MSSKFSIEDRRRLAAKAGVSEVYLYQCLTGFRDMKPADAVQVEIKTASEITRRDLRRDWAEIWPELIPARRSRAKALSA
jgi:DNA-binding transcriptional regulator YdaS (Cro superfamily)